MKVWLDDVRPAPDGWVLVTSYEEFARLLVNVPDGSIEEMSLDHDLAVCGTCANMSSTFAVVVFRCVPASCECMCHRTGLDCVKFMAMTGRWPATPPRVHSVYPTGKRSMELLIAETFGTRGRTP